MMLFKLPKVKASSADGGADYFDFAASMLHEVTLFPYKFIICLDYMHRTYIDKMKDSGFKLAKERSRKYPTQTIKDAEYADDIAPLANIPSRAETMLHCLEGTVADICLYVNADKTEYMCFNQRSDISTRNGCSLKLEDKFTYLRSSVSSTETDINTRLSKVVSILLYGCTTWTLTKRIEKKLDSNYTRMPRTILNKYGRQHSSKKKLYGH